MNTNNKRQVKARPCGFSEPQQGGKCVVRGAKESLYGYISGALESFEAVEVEDHLLGCRPCRDFFVTMLDVRAEARTSKELRDAEGIPEPDGTQVIRLGDFRKR